MQVASVKGCWVIQHYQFNSVCKPGRWLGWMISGFDIEGLPSAVWPGGETEALTRIERHLERKVSTALPVWAIWDTKTLKWNTLKYILYNNISFWEYFYYFPFLELWNILDQLSIFFTPDLTINNIWHLIWSQYHMFIFRNIHQFYSSIKLYPLCPASLLFTNCSLLLCISLCLCPGVGG